MRLEGLAQLFDTPQVQAILLAGSFARDEAGPYSDIDILRLTNAPLDSSSHLWQDRLVNVNDANVEATEIWLSDPERAVDVIVGLRNARVLLDKDGAAEKVLGRARAFVWTTELQQKADVWASAHLAGWAEEAHKGLAGLNSGNPSQLLHAQFGLSWGLAKVMRVQRGLFSSSDNTFLSELQKAFVGTRWLELLEDTYGLTGLPLVDQVRSGLKLYCLTAHLLSGVLQPDDRPIVEHTVSLIQDE